MVFGVGGVFCVVIYGFLDVGVSDVVIVNWSLDKVWEIVWDLVFNLEILFWDDCSCLFGEVDIVVNVMFFGFKG